LEEEIAAQDITPTPLFGERENKIGSKIYALRYLLCGRSFTDFTVFQNFEKERLPKSDFADLAQRVYSKVDEVADQKLRERRELLKGKKILLEVDCRWATKGYDAHEATVSGFGEDGKLLIVVNLFREGKFKNCEVEAKGMEGLGVKKICEILKSERIELATMLHDADSSSYNNARAIFPHLQEILCNNHTTKNIR
jgi:hypothetical protein